MNKSEEGEEAEVSEPQSTALAQTDKLASLVEKAAARLATATTAAEFLDVLDHAKAAYDAAKTIERFAKVKEAHDTVIAACHKAQGDALNIETCVQCRLADEYDGALARGEVKDVGKPKQNVLIGNNLPSVTDLGLTRKQVHEARLVRDAEKAKPGLTRKVVDDKLDAGEAPTRAQVKRAVQEVLRPKQPTPKPDQSKRSSTSATKPSEPERAKLKEPISIEKLAISLPQARWVYHKHVDALDDWNECLTELGRLLLISSHFEFEDESLSLVRPFDYIDLARCLYLHLLKDDISRGTLSSDRLEAEVEWFTD